MLHSLITEVADLRHWPDRGNERQDGNVHNGEVVMAATKVDFKRELHAFYSAGSEPVIVDVPEMAFLMIDGHGDPNTASEYGEAIAALYPAAYAAKFAVKGGSGGLDFAVMPLEGLWWVSDMSMFTPDDKSAWDWTILIMQPDQVTQEIVEEAKAKVAKKNPSEAVTGVRLERFAEGRAAQVMHVGPYSAEAPTIAGLHSFIADRGYVRAGKHHEVYLSDPRRTAPGKMKTIIRQPVAVE
jgi:hypothetical protein